MSSRRLNAGSRSGVRGRTQAAYLSGASCSVSNPLRCHRDQPEPSFVNPLSTRRPPPCPLSSWTSSSATPSSSSLSSFLKSVSVTHWHAVVHLSSLFLHPPSLVLGPYFFADAIEYSPSQGDRACLFHATGGDLNSFKPMSGRTDSFSFAASVVRRSTNSS